MPTLNLNLPMNLGGDQKTQSYLYQLNEQLRYILNNLDGDNFSPTYLKTVEQTRAMAEIASDAVNQLEAGRKIDYNELNDKIIAQAEEINQTFHTEIEQNNDHIMTTVREELSAKASIAELNATLESYVTQTSREIQLNFDQNYLYTTEVDGRLEEFQELIRTYFRFTAEGMELGKADSPFKSMLTNEKLSFTQNGTEIAYISNRCLYVTDVEVLNRLRIGNWEFTPRSNGNLSFIWRE